MVASPRRELSNLLFAPSLKGDRGQRTPWTDSRDVSDLPLQEAGIVDFLLHELQRFVDVVAHRQQRLDDIRTKPPPEIQSIPRCLVHGVGRAFVSRYTLVLRRVLIALLQLGGPQAAWAAQTLSKISW
jgi:hypothetical protein